MLGPQLDPAIKSTFEECEKIFSHWCMLAAEVRFDHGDSCRVQVS
jgi:hypothetical protein